MPNQANSNNGISAQVIAAVSGVYFLLRWGMDSSAIWHLTGLLDLSVTILAGIVCLIALCVCCKNYITGQPVTSIPSRRDPNVDLLKSALKNVKSHFSQAQCSKILIDKIPGLNQRLSEECGKLICLEICLEYANIESQLILENCRSVAAICNPDLSQDIGRFDSKGLSHELNEKIISAFYRQVNTIKDNFSRQGGEPVTLNVEEVMRSIRRYVVDISFWCVCAVFPARVSRQEFAHPPALGPAQDPPAAAVARSADKPVI